MADLHNTDRYDPSRNSFKQCLYCESPNAKGRGSITIGLCERHLTIFSDDIAGGWKVNRLKSLMDAHSAQPVTQQLSLF